MDGLRCSGVITLTTDFGLRDPFVGVVKGRILDRFPAGFQRLLTPSRPITSGESPLNQRHRISPLQLVQLP